MTAHSPDLAQLSAYLDGELDAPERQRLATHLAACPLCAGRLAELQTLSTRFKALPEESLGFDLAGVIEGRLAAMPAPRAARRRPTAWSWWPIALGAALSLSAGSFMGSALVVGSAATAPRVTAMRVFDTMPPGSLCLGLDACYAKGNIP
jgi:anti-sigma factor RsiW